jgi:hypothetical protein
MHRYQPGNFFLEFCPVIILSECMHFVINFKDPDFLKCTRTLLSILNSSGDNNIQTGNNIITNKAIHNIRKVEGYLDGLK